MAPVAGLTPAVFVVPVSSCDAVWTAGPALLTRRGVLVEDIGQTWLAGLALRAVSGIRPQSGIEARIATRGRSPPRTGLMESA